MILAIAVEGARRYEYLFGPYVTGFEIADGRIKATFHSRWPFETRIEA